MCRYNGKYLPKIRKVPLRFTSDQFRDGAPRNLRRGAPPADNGLFTTLALTAAAFK